MRHTRDSFLNGEFSHFSNSSRATELHLQGFPPQVDANLIVGHHRFEAGHTTGTVTLNKITLDVFVFGNEGTWIEDSKQTKSVSCGHVVVLPGIENWHMCGQSSVGQDGCASGDKGVTLDVLVRFSDVDNWVASGRTASDLDVRLVSPSADWSAARTFQFDSAVTRGNFLTPSNMYVHAGLWSAPAPYGAKAWVKKAQPQWTLAPHARGKEVPCLAPSPPVFPHQCSRLSEATSCGKKAGCKFVSRCGCREAGQGGRQGQGKRRPAGGEKGEGVCCAYNRILSVRL